MSTASKVAAHKRANPSLYCSVPSCLWRINTPRGPNPCRNHPLRPMGAVQLVPGDGRRASFDVPTFEVIRTPDIAPVPDITLSSFIKDIAISTMRANVAMAKESVHMEAIAEDRARDRERHTGITANDAPSDPHYPNWSGLSPEQQRAQAAADADALFAPLACDQCGDPATVAVRADSARFSGLYCDSCAPLAVHVFANRGIAATIEPMPRGA